MNLAVREIDHDRQLTWGRDQELLVSVTGDKRPDFGYLGFGLNQATLFKHNQEQLVSEDLKPYHSHHIRRIRDQRADD